MAEKPLAILIAPWWPHQNWFPLLLRLLNGIYCRLLLDPDLLLLEGKDSLPS